jgi:hypothetical protein
MRGVPDARGAAVAGVGAALIALAIAAWSNPAPDTTATPWPSAAELDSLAAYLAPTAPAPRVDDYAAFVPARHLPAAPPPGEPPAAAQTHVQLSAILIAGARPVAIINDQTVLPGARLEGGAVVLSIEPDHVLIREPDGSRRRVFLTAG